MAAANENQWCEFWQRLQAGGDGLPVWRKLQAAYTESWRAYHNLHHIGHCLEEFSAVRQLADDAIAVEAAIWFHDVIYDTHRKDNEERSADFAMTVLRTAAKSEVFCRNVHALILATRHQSQPASHDARLLTDIDLSILGQSSERYAEFEQQIRQEYAWVSESDFAAGRSAVLTNFAERKAIYATSVLREKYESPARRNLAWAIQTLARVCRLA